MLLSEVEHNTEIVRTVRETRPALIGSPNLSLIKTETWRATRAKVAKLVPSELLEDLESYYAPLETLLTLLKFEGRLQETGERWLRAALSEKLGEELTRSRDPFTEYAIRMLEMQNRVREQITEYLDRTAIDNLLLEFIQWLERQRRHRTNSSGEEE